METIKLSKDNIRDVLVPFKYKGALIYATSFKIESKNNKGFFGFGQNAIFFENIDNLPEVFEIDIPASTDELQEFITAIDYILHKISLNGNSIFIKDINEKVPLTYILTPFVLFLKNYEQNILDIERIKNGN
jgi:hypothetical protein